MITFSDTITPKSGGDSFKINVDKANKPFGQIWYFRGHTATVHAKTLAGNYKVFEGGSLALRLHRAMDWIKTA